MKRKCKILKGGSTNVVRYKKCIKVELSSIYLKTKKQPLKRRKKKEDKPKSFFDWMIKKRRRILDLWRESIPKLPLLKFYHHKQIQDVLMLSKRPLSEVSIASCFQILVLELTSTRLESMCVDLCFNQKCQSKP